MTTNQRYRTSLPHRAGTTREPVGRAIRPREATLLGLRASQLLLESHQYAALKDPCVVRLDDEWHLFATAAYEGYRYDVLHAVTTTPQDRWRLLPAVHLPELAGGGVAAPGLIADEGVLHLFLQTEYNQPGGRIEHLVSRDRGRSFDYSDTALESVPDTSEDGIYDAHPSRIRGERYLVYSGFSVVGQPDLHLARSQGPGWSGPWERMGPILQHPGVPGHNQTGHPEYEWGLEGGQIVALPSGDVLLNAVCFLADAQAGERQQLFFALASNPAGPYEFIGLPVADGDGSETGHGAVDIQGDHLRLFFQQRPRGGSWRLAYAQGELPSAA